MRSRKRSHKTAAHPYGREAGIQLHAPLEGKPEWAKPDRREEGVGFIRWVRDYNAAVPEEDGFSAASISMSSLISCGLEGRAGSHCEGMDDSMDRWIREAREAGLFHRGRRALLAGQDSGARGGRLDERLGAGAVRRHHDYGVRDNTSKRSMTCRGR